LAGIAIPARESKNPFKDYHSTVSSAFTAVFYVQYSLRRPVLYPIELQVLTENIKLSRLFFAGCKSLGLLQTANAEHGGRSFTIGKRDLGTI